MDDSPVPTPPGCAYVDERGVRCRETAGLELRHRQAFALGGPPMAPNLELACHAHNLLAAEQDFGGEPGCGEQENGEPVAPSEPGP